LEQKTTQTQGKISKDLIPVAFRDRKTGGGGYFNLWIGLSVIIATFAVGGEGIVQMPLGYVLLACLIGNILLGGFVSITGDIGIEHGISFPVYIKTLFGTKGIIVPSIIRAIYGAIWFGIQTYFGAIAINVIVRSLTGTGNWLIWYILFAVVQVVNTAMGFKAIARLANVAAPTIIIVAIYMLINLSGQAAEQNINLWNTVVDNPNPTINFFTIFVLMIMNMTYWASSSADAQTLTRYIKTTQNEKNWFKRNKSALMGHMIGLPIGQTFMIAVGAISMIVVSNYNPIEAMQSMAGGFLLVILLLMIVMAQWSTNAGGNLLPPAIAIVDVSRSKVSYPIAVVITGIFGSVIMPWKLMEVGTFNLFLEIIGTLWASFAGMTLSDYYLLRKRRLNIPDLYKKEGGQYSYADGWNWCGVISLLISISIPIVSMFTNSSIGQLSYFIGFIAAGGLYFVLAKYWWFKKYNQAELADTQDKYLGTTVGRDWEYDEAKNIIVPSK
jgi:NCS1 family nucleobase:cation symporter-1